MIHNHNKHQIERNDIIIKQIQDTIWSIENRLQYNLKLESFDIEQDRGAEEYNQQDLPETIEQFSKVSIDSTHCLESYAVPEIDKIINNLDMLSKCEQIFRKIRRIGWGQSRISRDRHSEK